MKKYISGPISGMPILAAEKIFNHAAVKIKATGHEPVNPFEISKNLNSTWSEHMFIDLMGLIHQSEGIYMLNGWKRSVGAGIEYSVNLQLQRPDEFEIDADKLWPRFEPRFKGVLTRGTFRLYNMDHQAYWVDPEIERPIIYKRRIHKMQHGRKVGTAQIKYIEHFGFLEMISILRGLDPDVHIPKPYTIPIQKPHA